jgi:hypothetical protein
MSIIISNNVQVGQSGTSGNNITINTSASGDLVVNKGVWPNITEITRVSNAGLIDGNKVSFTPTGTISATTVQAAIVELSTELTAPISTPDGAALVGFTPSSGSPTDVQTRLRLHDTQISTINTNISGISTGGAAGGGTDKVFYENDSIVTTNYSITAGKNALSAGPITINNGVAINIPTGSSWGVI